MRIERVVLRTLRLRLREPFRTAGGAIHERTVLLLHLEGDGVEGVAECVAPDTPHYTPETTATARWVIERHLAPAVLGRSFERAATLGPMLDRAAKGHPMAKAAIEMAAWDAEARGRGQPLAAVLGATRERVPAGVSLGFQPDTRALLERVEAALALGYRRVKIKIEPGRDLAVLKAVRDRFPDAPLTADANGTYSCADLDRLRTLDRLGLLYLEQPFPDHALVEHAKLQAELETPVCLDESIGSPDHCRTALALDACRVVNIKPGRVGGHGPARAIHDLCREAEVGVWCGGMLETGVGRAHNVALAALPHMTLPGDLSASRRYWERDIVVPPFELDGDGFVAVPTGPGIGVRLDEDFMRHIEVDRLDLH